MINKDYESETDILVENGRVKLRFWLTYLRASALIFPSAWTAASLTSATSHRSRGITSLYSPLGEVLTALLSVRSVVRLSGDELKYRCKY